LSHRIYVGIPRRRLGELIEGWPARGCSGKSHDCASGGTMPDTRRRGPKPEAAVR
jgi:hypothetical protein